MRSLCSHLCRDPMLILLRKQTWGHMDAYEALWRAWRCGAGGSSSKTGRPVLSVGGGRVDNTITKLLHAMMNAHDDDRRSVGSTAHNTHEDIQPSGFTYRPSSDSDFHTRWVGHISVPTGGRGPSVQPVRRQNPKPGPRFCPGWNAHADPVRDAR